MTFDNPARLPDATFFEALVKESLQVTFGSCGGAQCVWQLLSFNADTGIGILRSKAEHLANLRLALTLISRFGGRRCRVDVVDVAPSLAALACARFDGTG